jgi:hypothetical protein
VPCPAVARRRRRLKCRARAPPPCSPPWRPAGATWGRWEDVLDELHACRPFSLPEVRRNPTAPWSPSRPPWPTASTAPLRFRPPPSVFTAGEQPHTITSTSFSITASHPSPWPPRMPVILPANAPVRRRSKCREVGDEAFPVLQLGPCLIPKSLYYFISLANLQITPQIFRSFAYRSIPRLFSELTLAFYLFTRSIVNHN